MNDILIIAATKTELPSIEGAIKTGFGKEKTRKTMEKIIKSRRLRRPSLVISVGLVGAVIPELKVGDIFIPDAIIDYENPEKRYSPSPIPLRLAGAGTWGERVRVRVRGLLVTVPKVFKSEDKYKLKEIIPDATCVDMETSGVVEVLEPLGIPLICIKAVSDELGFDFRNKKLLSENIKIAIKSYSDFLCKILKQILYSVPECLSQLA